MHTSFMRCILLLLPALSSAVSTRAGLRVRTSEAGLNTLLKFATDHLVRPYLENNLNDLEISFQDVRYSLKNIQIPELVNPSAVVDIQEDNYVGVQLSVEKFSIAANVSLNNGFTVDIYPDTVVIFEDMHLEIALQLQKEGKLIKIALKTCSSNIGRFDSTGELSDVLLGLYEIASEKIVEMTESVCGSIQNQTEALLNSFFDVTSSLRISTHGRDVALFYSLESITSDNDDIQIDFRAALNQADLTDGVADFPAPSTLSNGVRGRHMEMWFNGELLTTILSRLMNLDIFTDTSYTASEKRYSSSVRYNIRTTDVRLTPSGAVVISHAVFNVETNACAQMSVNLTAEMPVKFEYGFTSLKFGFDDDRLKLTYRVAHSTKTINCPDEPQGDVTKAEQKIIIKEFNGHLEKLIRDNFIMTTLKFDYDDGLNLKDTSVSTVQNALAVVTSINIGQPILESNVTKTNTDYQTKKVSLTYEDGTVVSLQKGSGETDGVIRMSAAMSLVSIMAFVAVLLF